jgi:exopolyphosphatase/guanosine-5'-triphosphate,3'-diphosphate pyrophosphatase
MQDPLISVATDVALLEARNCELGNAFYDWIYPIFKHLGIRKQRIIKAICLFSDMGWRHHPDYRAANIVRAILYGGWLGMTHLERITIANGVGFRYDSSFKLIDILSDFQKVQELDNDFQDYMTWSQSVGLAIRIGYLMCGFSIPLLQKCSLKIENNRLILELSADVKLSSDAVKKRVSHLAESLNIEYDIIIV